MLFNSLEFFLFLPIVFILYWFVFSKKLKLQNALVVFASYFFYGWWDWRFLALIFFSSLLDFNLSNLIHASKSAKTKKYVLRLSLLTNLSLLGFFKYYNFFVESLIDSFTFFGNKLDIHTLEILLPVGISFYTFQTLSYTIDVYRGKLKPSNDLISFLAFVSFFPQLVAGPIERATHLLPQFYKKRQFNYSNAVDGMKQILWGFFKKIVIADSAAIYVNHIYDNPVDYSGSTLFLATFFFAFQIYGDFSGYSDIAIGVSRLFGFDLMQNFKFPYFSRDIAEFWRRWHISLTTWFRDYIYIPLGGSKVSMQVKIRNTFVIFLISGFWHGANWTFVIWGLLNALLFLPLLILSKNRKNTGTIGDGNKIILLSDLIKVVFTFSLVLFTWIFFRSNTLSDAFIFFDKIFSSSLFTLPDAHRSELLTLLLILFFMTVEWLGRFGTYALQTISFKYEFSKYLFFSFLFFLVGMYMQLGEMNFIYFQF